MIQQSFSFDSNQGFRFVVEDIQIKMKLLTCSMYYEPIRIAVETVAFGGPTIEDLAGKVVTWAKQDMGLISLQVGNKIQIITNSVVVTGKVLDDEGRTVDTSLLERHFVKPFLKTTRQSVYLFQKAYAAHKNAARETFKTNAR